METGSHIPLGIGCTFTLAIAVPLSAIGSRLPMMVMNHFLAMLACVKSADSGCRHGRATYR